MSNLQWVGQVRELLAKAKHQQSAMFSNLDVLKSSIDAALQMAEQAREDVVVIGTREIPYAVRRRNLRAQIHLILKRYGLFDEVQAFVYAAGHSTTQGLELTQLEALHGWLVRTVDRLQTACDSDFAPPAR